MIREHGFKVLFLYGDPAIQVPEIRKKRGEHCLYVPVEDTYDNLTHKLLDAYRFLLGQNVEGILKIDDNTVILDYRVFKSNFKWYDYSGAEVGTIYPGTCELKSGNTFNVEEVILYFGGPFYWLSLRGLEQVVKTGFKYPAEDMNMGYAINMNDSLLIGNMMFRDNKMVSWDNTTE